MRRDISHIFNKFTGREVPLKEEPIKIGKETYTQLKLANPNDPVLKEMQETAKAHGLKLRVFWPGVRGTADARIDRANTTLEKGADGKWRVGKNFRIG